jgi:WXG100 family type VII secretion target
MPDVSVTYQEMETVAQRLTAGYEEISGMLTQLKAQVDQLVSSGFVTDISSKKFEEAYTEFNSGVTHTLEGLQEMSQFLTATANKFRELDTTSQ